jgi:hypothetical protein
VRGLHVPDPPNSIGMKLHEGRQRSQQNPDQVNIAVRYHRPGLHGVCVDASVEQYPPAGHVKLVEVPGGHQFPEKHSVATPLTQKEPETHKPQDKDKAQHKMSRAGHVMTGTERCSNSYSCSALTSWTSGALPHNLSHPCCSSSSPIPECSDGHHLAVRGESGSESLEQLSNGAVRSETEQGAHTSTQEE